MVEKFLVWLLATSCLLVRSVSGAAELPLVRIAHGAFNEKGAAVWGANEQGFYRKHGVNVKVINIRTGPQTMAAIASGEIQIAFTIPGSVVSAAAAGGGGGVFVGVLSSLAAWSVWGWGRG